MKKTIVLGVTGSIAAYKAADIANRLNGKGYDVHAILTQAGAGFITPLTLQALTGNRVYTHVLQEDNPAEIVHIDLARRADLLLVAPATANSIAKLAHGIADDMLTSLALAAAQDTACLVAPAMNTRMYQNPITQQNLATLKARGWQELEPRESRLACGDVGKGALAGVDTIVNAAITALGGA